MRCIIHLFHLTAVIALSILAVACGRREGAPTPAGDAGAATRTTSATPRAVRVAPDLVGAKRITTARVARRAPSGAVRLPADVVASPDGSAEAGTLLAGRVARFEAREGDRVKRGQVLAWLDAPEAGRAVADLLRARARTETQEKKVARLQGLVASEAATQIALEEARLELALARADLAAARTLAASVGLPEPPAAGAGAVLAAQLPVRSPVDGTVVERSAPLGAHVTPDDHLFRLVTEGRVLVEARVADGSPVVLAPGSTARVETRSGARCSATVLGALPQVEAATRSRRVRLAPEASCKGLVPGAQADVEIEIAAAAAVDGGTEHLLLVPAASIIEVKGAPVVFVKGREPGVFDLRPVEPGLRMGDDRAVNAGVSEGEEVVVDGAVLLKGELMRSELGGEE